MSYPTDPFAADRRRASRSGIIGGAAFGLLGGAALSTAFAVGTAYYTMSPKLSGWLPYVAGGLTGALALIGGFLGKYSAEERFDRHH